MAVLVLYVSITIPREVDKRLHLNKLSAWTYFTIPIPRVFDICFVYIQIALGKICKCNNYSVAKLSMPFVRKEYCLDVC